MKRIPWIIIGLVLLGASLACKLSSTSPTATTAVQPTNTATQTALPTATLEPTSTPTATLEPSPSPTSTPIIVVVVVTATPVSDPVELTRAACEKVTYIVESGDSLGRISATFNIPMQAILSYNNLSSDVLYVGMQLIIPLCEKTTTLPADPTATNAPSPTLVPSPTSVSPISEPTRSATTIYYSNATCGATDLTLTVTALDPKVFSVFVFLRLKDKASEAKTNWNDGLPLVALGNGKFSITLPTNKIPGYNSYAESWLLFQFVATDKSQVNLGRSVVYSDTTLKKCP